MSWSCTTNAARTLTAWESICRRSTGTSNTWRHDGREYFLELGREQDDGAATGSIYMMIGQSFRRKSTFRIEPSGEFTRGPKYLRHAVERLRVEQPEQYGPIPLGGGGAEVAAALGKE